MLYIPTLNPIVFAPVTEKDPTTGDWFAGRAQMFPSGAYVQVQMYTDEERFPVLYYDYDDGTSAPAGAVLEHSAFVTGVLDGVKYLYLCYRLVLPHERAFRVRIPMGETAAVSGCLCTGNTAGLCRLSFSSPEYLEGDTLMADGDYTFTPTVWVKGGFYTSGFNPDIDSEDFLDQNRVSRYTSAFPFISRDFTIGGAQGIDNRLAAFLNAAFCLPGITIDGRPYARYSGATLKSLGDKQLPCRAWSIALQNADGDNAVAFGPAADSGVLVDADGAYLVDADNRYI